MKNKSKYLSLILRHQPEKVNITLDKEGYAGVEDILKALDITKEELDEIVNNNDKKRFWYDATKTKIRAAQGHSIKVDLNLQPLSTVPNILYHGTKEEYLPSIKKLGLQKQSRNHVHLSFDEETAKKVADRRKGKSIILKINAFQMRGDGFKFYLSENKIYLTDNVPAKYISY